MGPIAPAIGYIAAAATVVGTVMSYQQSRRAASAQEDAAEAQRQRMTIEQNMANLKVEKQKQEQIRRARSERGQVLNIGATTGTTQSSGVQGGTSSIMSQLGGNLSYMDTQQANAQKASIFSQRANAFQSQAAQHSANSQMWGQVASSAYGTFGGAQQFQQWGKQMAGSGGSMSGFSSDFMSPVFHKGRY